MSYEKFRSSLSSRLIMILSDEQLEAVLYAVDSVACAYDIRLRPTDIITVDPLPETVRSFIAARSVENLAEGTLKLYFLTLCNFFLAVRKPPSQISTNDIRVYLHRYRSERHVKDVTVDGIRVVLSTFFEWCVDEELLPKNPVRRIASFKVPKSQRSAMNPIELELMRFACSNARQKALVDFLYTTGARVNEVRLTLISDIDWESRTVLIRHGKGDKQRLVYLNAESVISLRAYLGERSDDCPFLFVQVRGKEKHGISSRSIQKEIRRIAEAAGVRTHVTPHVFRHTAATTALRNGMPVEQVQRLLGHSNINTTMIYAKVDDSDVRHSHEKYVG